MDRTILSSILLSIIICSVYAIILQQIIDKKTTSETNDVSLFLKQLTKSFFLESEINEKNIKSCEAYIIENLKENNLLYKFKLFKINIVKENEIEIKFILKNNLKKITTNKLSIIKNR